MFAIYKIEKKKKNLMHLYNLPIKQQETCSKTHSNHFILGWLEW